MWQGAAGGIFRAGALRAKGPASDEIEQEVGDPCGLVRLAGASALCEHPREGLSWLADLALHRVLLPTS